VTVGKREPALGSSSGVCCRNFSARLIDFSYDVLRPFCQVHSSIVDLGFGEYAECSEFVSETGEVGLAGS
jgi:hypothetical protein